MFGSSRVLSTCSMFINSETSGSLLFVTLLTSCHAMNSSNCEGVKGAFFKIVGFVCKRFLLSFPLPLHALICARPNFSAAKKAKSASNVRKALPKRLLRRLNVKNHTFLQSTEYGCTQSGYFQCDMRGQLYVQEKQGKNDSYTFNRQNFSAC